MATDLNHKILDEQGSPILDESGRALLSSFPVPDQTSDITVLRPRHDVEGIDSGASPHIRLNDSEGDVQSYYSGNDEIELRGSTDDDGFYTVSSTGYQDLDTDGNKETIIYVNEAISNTTDVAATVQVYAIAELTFGDSSNASNYLILRSGSYRGTMTEVANISQSTKDGNEPAYSYQDTGLIESNSYRYQVRAVNQNNADNMPSRRSSPAYSPGSDKTLT